MRILLFSFVAVLQLCAAFPSEPQLPRSHGEGVEHPQPKTQLNPVLEDAVPPLASKGPVKNLETPNDLQNSLGQKSTATFVDNVNLKWLSWNGVLPNGAVGIYNGYVSRTDYVCKLNCEAGFYTPSKGPYCFYPYADREYAAPEFDILVNEDNFEFLQWKDDSYGSVPPYSVRTCSGVNTFVGKNKYGLGKISTQHEAFFLPWDGDEYWYKTYQVLTINKDVYAQHISHVEYNINEVEIFQYPPETMRISSVVNNECQTVTKTVTIEKRSEVASTWDIKRSTMLGVTGGISAKIPIIGSAGIEFTWEKTLQFSYGTTLVETISHTVAVELHIPPNQSCTVRMEGRKITADIPFKARLSRTYSNGETQWTSIAGVYDGVQIGEIRAVIDRCEPIADAKPCP
ncbi:natterin-3-like [Paramormyrops kingsleyae]|uniref:natterin-3-like n=1 Tax=Paramormyrops kingsleyae TaxID=1676925 RepID=UPI003B976BEE